MRSRCPHLLFRNVLGTETCAALLDYVTVNQRDFTPAKVSNWESGQKRIDPVVRDCYRLTNLGPFEAPLRAWLDGIAPQMLHKLGLSEAAVEPHEFEICAYRDGGHFVAHSDTSKRLERVRILSCVYYFAAAPSRFSGGLLRLHGFPTAAGKAGDEPSISRRKAIVWSSFRVGFAMRCCRSACRPGLGRTGGSQSTAGSTGRADRRAATHGG